MRIYVEAKLPEWSLPIEAVFWLAFGRAPEASVDEWKDYEGEYHAIDYRMNPNVVGDTGPDVEDYPLPEEIEATGTPVDAKKYLDGVYSSQSEDRRQQLDETMRRLEESGRDVSDYWISKQYDLAATRYAEEMQTLVQPLIDEARAEVFLALRNGKIRSQAYRWRDADCRSHFFEEIPADSWKLDMLVEDPPRFEDPREGFACLYVRTSDVLAAFPVPKGVINRNTGERTVFSAVLDEKSTAEIKSRRPRGAPQKADGVAQAAIRVEISRQMGEGQLSGKKEADVQYAIEWSEKNLGVKVSRTTMQRWIGDILDQCP